MRISNFFYCIKQGFKNIHRNRTFSLASIATISCCLFLFGVFFCILFNFRDIVSNAETSVGVSVFFQEGVNEDQIMEFKQVVEIRDEVESVTYISADEAWDEFSKVYFDDGDKGVLENLDMDNPLAGSDSLTIYLKDTSKQDELVKFLQTQEIVRKINASETVAEGFANFSRLIGYASLGLIIILLAVAIFLIRNTVMIGITVRKDEIAIMKYIGATDTFVRGPFLVEGIIIGLLGSAIPVAILRVLYVEVVKMVNQHFAAISNILTFSDAHSVFILLIPITLVIGLGIGFFGSYATLHKHIRV